MLCLVMPKETEHNRARVSQWERGIRKPPHDALIIYASIGGISLDQLMREDLALPNRLLRPKAEETENATSPELPAAGEETNGAAFENDTDGNATIENESDQSSRRENAGQDKPDAQESDEQSEYQSAATVKSDAGWWLKLPFSLDGENSEAVTFTLPSVTLDELSDLHLEVLGEIPRHLRSSMTIDSLVNYALQIVITNHRREKQESIVGRRLHRFNQEQE